VTILEAAEEYHAARVAYGSAYAAVKAAEVEQLAAAAQAPAGQPVRE